MAITMERLLAAVQAMFNDPSSYAAANEWLTSFQQSSLAWSLSVQLLRHPSAEVRFFGASTLHHKVRAHWGLSTDQGGLAPADQQALMNQLLAELQVACEAAQASGGSGQGGQQSMATASKLALALAAMAAKTANGPSEMITILLPSAQAAPPSVLAVTSLTTLEVLAALAEEVAKLSSGSYVRTEEVAAQLRRHGDDILRVLAVWMREGVQHRAQAAHAADPRLNKALAGCLSVLAAWIRYGVGLEQLASSGVLQSIGQLYELLMRSSSQQGTVGLIEQVTELLEHALDTSSFPRPKARDAAVDDLLRILLSARDTYTQLVQQCLHLMSQGSQQSDALDQCEQVCTYIARLSSALGEQEMDYLACHAGSDDFPALSPGGSSHPGSVVPPGNPLHQQYFEFHLALTQHPYDLVLVEASLDVWSTLQDQPVAERKFQFLKKDLFVSLMRTLLGHAAYPPSFTHWTQPLASPSVAAPTAADLYFRRRFLEDPDAFRRFRGIMLETFLSCYGILGLDYVHLLAGAMGVQTDQQQQQQQPTWQATEAALMAFLPIAPELREALGEFFEDSSIAPQEKQRTRALLDAVSAKIWSWAPAEGASSTAPTTPALLLATGCAFVKSYGFLLGYSESQEKAQHHLEQDVTYLLRCMPATQVTAGTVTAFSSEGTGAPQDAANIAGLAFKALCGGEATTRMRLIHSPQILGTIVRLLFHTPGFSALVATPMKQLWLQGLAHLVTAIAYSEEAVSQVQPSDQPSASMAMAASYLQEITSPPLGALGHIFATLQGLQAQHGGTYQPSPAEFEQIRSGVRDNLQLLSSVLQTLSYPADTDTLQWKELLIERIGELPSATPRPSSVALQVFSSCWPFLQQAIGLFGPLKEADTLNGVVSIYSASISLLYGHELQTTLQQILTSAMSIYTAVPLPAVLKLVEKAVSTRNYGHLVDLRDTWCTLVSQVYKQTMEGTKDQFKAHTDVYEAFFDLAAALYENCTYCLVCNPANPLTHMIQFCVTVLDSLSSQRGCLQKCLYFLEQLLGNTAALDILPEKVELRSMVHQIFSEQGGGLVRQLLASLGDELPPLIASKVASVLYLAQERFPQLARPWIEKALTSDYFAAAAPHLTQEHTAALLALAWPLRTNKHQWRALFVQFNLVCLRRDTFDSLASFELVGTPNGARLRSSPAADAAFATL